MSCLAKCGTALLFFATVSTVQAVTILTVSVDNTGNGNTWINGSGGGSLGAVDYDYNVGKYEVTAGQYTAFLNAVAATDTYNLYNTYMATANVGCGITRSGSAGSYTYSVSASYIDRPVNYVSWGDAARFVNWMQNGQRTGVQDSNTTEDGAYYLNGATTIEELMAVTREVDWQWALPTDSEWYKAGYHKNDGDTANYFAYPTSSDSAPGMAKNLAGFPNTVDDPGNYANYGGVYSGVRYTTVGELEDSASPYGTFDQAGNVGEWTEGVYNLTRSVLGGYYNTTASTALGKTKYTYDPTTESGLTGFRVVTNVPEPMTISLLVIGSLGLIARKRTCVN